MKLLNFIAGDWESAAGEACADVFDASSGEKLGQQQCSNGAQVERTDGRGPVGVGATWDVAFTFRNKDRKLRAVVSAPIVEGDSNQIGLWI